MGAGNKDYIDELKNSQVNTESLSEVTGGEIYPGIPDPDEPRIPIYPYPDQPTPIPIPNPEGDKIAYKCNKCGAVCHTSRYITVKKCFHSGCDGIMERLH